MIDEIIRWAKNIVFVVLITNFLQLLLPEGDMKKYVRVVMGFFIIVVFISPLASVLHGDFESLYHIFPSEKSGGWGDITEEGLDLEGANREMINQQYKERLGKQIENIAGMVFPELKREVEVGINDEMQIQSIVVYLSGENNDIEEIEIGPIFSEEEKEEYNKNITKIKKEERQTEVNNLKTKLSSSYQISPGNIEIIFDHNF